MREVKKCNKCGETKPLSDWGENKAKKDGLQTRCKVCVREDNNRRYREDPKYKQRVKKNNKDTRHKVRLYVWEHLALHPCVDCGESDPVVLEFDHVRGEKKFSIANGIAHQTFPALKIEIEKCEVRCANCHRRKTAKERNYYFWVE